MLRSIVKFFYILIFLVITAFLTYATIDNKNTTPVYLSFYSPEIIKRQLITSAINTYNPRLSDFQERVIINSIFKEALRNNFDPFLITSIIAAESSFNPKAISPCQAQGLMQITDCVTKLMRINDPFNIEENIFAGTRYLKDMYCQFNQYELALAAYNAGPTRVARVKGVPKITETINYIKKITRFHNKLTQDLLLSVSEKIAAPIFAASLQALNKSTNIFVNDCNFLKATVNEAIFLATIDMAEVRNPLLFLI